MKLSQIKEGKVVYRLPYHNPDHDACGALRFGTNWKKDRIIQIKQLLLNKKFGDRRQLKSLTQHTNPHGETFIFGTYGHGKNSIVVTIGQVIAKNWLMMDIS